MKAAKTATSRPEKRVTAKSATTESKDEYVLRLFVAGATARSTQAILRVRELCEAELKGRCDLEVIDIYQQPALARSNQIVATPTLIMEVPKPMRRFIGSLTNIAGLLVELNLSTTVKITL
jgi:circadian clock protein KaiB